MPRLTVVHKHLNSVAKEKACVVTNDHFLIIPEYLSIIPVNDKLKISLIHTFVHT